MNTQKVAQDEQAVQPQILREAPLTAEGRRLLLGASIRLLGRRFSCGKPILQDDVLRVVSLADDALMPF